MARRPGLRALAALLLAARAAALLSPRYTLRNEHDPPTNCGFADYGSAVGTAQRLVETHLTPGVADWNIVVPMPPPCVGATLTGVDMRVCDGDAPPDVTLSDLRSARVHRTGSLADFATVNVTVYCILPTVSPPPPTPTLFGSRSDPMSAYELSNEQTSDEVAFNKETSDESEASAEQATPVNLTTTSPPVQEQTTARNNHTLPTEVLTQQPNSKSHSREQIQPSLKVTINIASPNRMSTGEDMPSNNEEPNEVTPSHSPRLSSEPYVVTPPRISGMPPRKRLPARQPGSLQYQEAGSPGPPPYPESYPGPPLQPAPYPGPPPQPASYSGPPPQPAYYSSPPPQPAYYAGPPSQPASYAGPPPQPTYYSGPPPQPASYASPPSQPASYPGPPPQPASYSSPPPQPVSYPGPPPQPGSYTDPPPRPAPYTVTPGPPRPPAPAPYQLGSQYPLTALASLAPFYRPLLGSRLTFLQRRQPILFFRYY